MTAWQCRHRTSFIANAVRNMSLMQAQPPPAAPRPLDTSFVNSVSDYWLGMVEIPLGHQDNPIIPLVALALLVTPR